MILESVLEELTRKSPLCQPLIKAAWPDLCTESRLQLIDAMLVLHMSRPPDWLVKLALGDAAAIVRFWGAKHAYFHHDTAEERALAERAEVDECALVRAVVRSPSLTIELPQLARLLAIRSDIDMSLSTLVSFLDAGLAAGIPGSELAECSEEFFLKPGVRAEFATKFTNGMEAHTAGSSMKDGWTLARKAEPELARSLAWNLPTKYGMGLMKAEELLQMPDIVLQYLVGRVYQTPEQQEVASHVLEHPERYSERVLNWASNQSDIERPELEKHWRRLSISRSGETLDAILEVKDQVTALESTVREGIGKRRGFFGS
ncbi:hypothetical protein EJO66_12590 [Variovorax beijingensis]|uniref:Uncharacterized protein n=1 Tax=Variovorax beijingensis TaxID=2496117 RepID=A0ABY0A7P4_9BURK|nr:hypothetical protein [Variovorax beijingensis]RSZ37533.1 hypothetical protein EJO66_12590 [Variovorax beijingensis]